MKNLKVVQQILKAMKLGGFVGIDNGVNVIRLMTDGDFSKKDIIEMIITNEQLNIMLQNGDIEFRFVTDFIFIYVK